MERFLLTNPFLKNLDYENMARIDARLNEWGLGQVMFQKQFDAWFNNFSKADQELAFKLFLNFTYYTEEMVETSFNAAAQAVDCELHERGLDWSGVLLVVPDEHGDSAGRHVYTAHKLMEVHRSRIISPRDFTSDLLRGKALIFVNDTHGSGKQFVREFCDKHQILKSGAAFCMVVGVVIAREAIELFESIGGLIYYPDASLPSVAEMQAFTAAEVWRLEELGKTVYPRHPLGFGGTGLLVGYSFQCPNNTLPLIWADGTNNEGGRRWRPLFAYLPKVKAMASALVAHQSQVVSDSSHARRVTDSERPPASIAEGSAGLATLLEMHPVPPRKEPVASVNQPIATLNAGPPENHQHIHNLITIKTRRKQILERQAAMSGMNCPPEIQMELEDLDLEIQSLEARL